MEAGTETENVAPSCSFFCLCLANAVSHCLCLPSLIKSPHMLENSFWTVSDLTRYIRELFEIDFRLQEVAVKGEASNITHARSGHLYFTLKDSGAQLKCVMWRSAAQKLHAIPQDGDALIVEGKMTVYEAGGNYQLIASRLETAGVGDLAAEFELLKKRLADEGLFDAEHKQPIPGFPEKIGIVTSANAAALRDILNVLRRRYPLADVLIAPTLVQGATAPAGIVRSLEWLDGRDDIDVILVSRGGGSMEDLWAFNDEAVARAIFNAKTPVISGVGHEIDFTIADFVADLRAPTPSVAAELATPDVSELTPSIHGIGLHLRNVELGRIEQMRWEVMNLAQRLETQTPNNALGQLAQTVDGYTLRIENAMSQRFQKNRAQLAVLKAQLDGVSPQATLARGYAIVRKTDGSIVSKKADVASGDALTITVSDGDVEAEVK